MLQQFNDQDIRKEEAGQERNSMIMEIKQIWVMIADLALKS